MVFPRAIPGITFSVEEQFRTVYSGSTNNWVTMNLSNGNWNNNNYNTTLYVRCVRETLLPVATRENGSNHSLLYFDNPKQNIFWLKISFKKMKMFFIQ